MGRKTIRIYVFTEKGATILGEWEIPGSAILRQR